MWADPVVLRTVPVLRTMQGVPVVRPRVRLLMECDLTAPVRALRTRADPVVLRMDPEYRTMQSVRITPLPAVGQKMVDPGASMPLPIVERGAVPRRNRPDGGTQPRRFNQARSSLRLLFRGDPVAVLRLFD